MKFSHGQKEKGAAAFTCQTMTSNVKVTTTDAIIATTWMGQYFKNPGDDLQLSSESAAPGRCPVGWRRTDGLPDLLLLLRTAGPATRSPSRTRPGRGAALLRVGRPAVAARPARRLGP